MIHWSKMIRYATERVLCCSKHLGKGPITAHIKYHEHTHTHLHSFQEWMHVSARAEMQVQNHFMSDQRWKDEFLCFSLFCGISNMREQRQPNGQQMLDDQQRQIQGKTDLNKHWENHIPNQRCLTAEKIAEIYLLTPAYAFIRALLCVCVCVFLEIEISCVCKMFVFDLSSSFYLLIS